MNVTLTPEVEDWIKSKVQVGAFESESDAVDAMLTEALEREKFRALRVELAKGVADEEHGRVAEGSIAYKRIQERIAPFRESGK